MLDRLASESAAAWYRRLLAREDWALAALASHAGKTALFESGLLSVTLAVVAGGQLAAGSAPPSVTVTLDPQVLAGAVFEPAALRRKMRIDGDADFALALTDVLARLRPDPAEDLARLFGDAPAQRLVDATSAALRALRDTAQRLARQGADYWVAENPMILGRQEFAGFQAELAALLARLDRLEMRADAAARSAGPRADAP
jgi:ubiquinone biosynthesis accessory factor UbiJ